MDIVTNLLLVLVGLFGLFFGGNWLVDGASRLARRFGVPSLIIGLTVVAFGTSAPELMVSLRAAMAGSSGIALGNVVGSNIFNTLWILGIGSLVTPIPFNHLSNFDILMIIFSSTLLLLAMTVGRRREINWVGGLFFLLCYLGYIAYLFQRG